MLSLQNDYKGDEEITSISNLLCELHQEPQPVLRALVLCEIYHLISGFHDRHKTNQTIITPLNKIPIKGSETPSLPHQRSRSGNVRINQNNRPDFQHAVFNRQRVLENLKNFVVNDLIRIFKCDPANLKPRLMERFEIGVKSTNQKRDLGIRVKHLAEAERALSRVTFHNGLGYVLKEDGATVAEYLADTTSHDLSSGTTGLVARLWCFGYVYTDEGLFVSNHAARKKTLESGENFFHSSYYGGGFVKCAGDISFINGKLTSISNLSGHYRPPPRNLVPVIQYLKRHQVPVEDVRVILNHEEFESLFLYSAPSAEELDGRSNWQGGYHDIPKEELPPQNIRVPEFLKSSASTEINNITRTPIRYLYKNEDHRSQKEAGTKIYPLGPRNF